jgi:hypothetical protein
MRKKLSIGLAFVALLAAGTGAAALTAGAGPESVQATTTITSTITTGTVTTVTTITTTTPDTTTATTTTTTSTTTTSTPPTPKKITICHHAFRAKSTKHVTIRINRSAWKAHQRHGDSTGACNTAAAKKFHSRKAHVAKFHHGRPK